MQRQNNIICEQMVLRIEINPWLGYNSFLNNFHLILDASVDKKKINKAATNYLLKIVLEIDAVVSRTKKFFSAKSEI